MIEWIFENLEFCGKIILIVMVVRSVAYFTNRILRIQHRDEAQWKTETDKLIAELSRPTPVNSDLILLGLTALPPDKVELRRTYHRVLMQVHPDRGGTNEKAAAVNTAYSRLERSYT